MARVPFIGRLFWYERNGNLNPESEKLQRVTLVYSTLVFDVLMANILE